jgi:hypothetical protein
MQPPQTITIDPPEETWAIVEIMGHSKYAGRVSECQQFGAPLIRVEVPAMGEVPAFEKHFGAASIFAITPCTEEVARAAAARFHARPITMVSFPARLPAPDGWHDAADDENDDDEYDDDEEDGIGPPPDALEMRGV